MMNRFSKRKLKLILGILILSVPLAACKKGGDAASAVTTSDEASTEADTAQLPPEDGMASPENAAEAGTMEPDTTLSSAMVEKVLNGVTYEVPGNWITTRDKKAQEEKARQEAQAQQELADQQALAGDGEVVWTPGEQVLPGDADTNPVSGLGETGGQETTEPADLSRTYLMSGDTTDAVFYLRYIPSEATEDPDMYLEEFLQDLQNNPAVQDLRSQDLLIDTASGTEVNYTSQVDGYDYDFDMGLVRMPVGDFLQAGTMVRSSLGQDYYETAKNVLDSIRVGSAGDPMMPDPDQFRTEPEDTPADELPESEQTGQMGRIAKPEGESATVASTRGGM